MQCNFQLNVNVLGPPPGVYNELHDRLSEMLSYPDFRNTEARESLAEHLRVPSTSVVLGSGATELIFLAPRVARARRGALLSPSFWEYRAALEAVLEPNCIDTISTSANTGFAPPWEAICSILTNEHVIFMGYPNNPTSRLPDRKTLVECIQQYPKTTFVIDETYLWFRGSFFEESLATDAVKYPNLLVINSLSKFFAVPGLRLGFAICNQDMARRIVELQVPYAIGSLSQAAVAVLLRDKLFHKRCSSFYDQERSWLYEQLKVRFGDILECGSPDTNFLLAQVQPQLKSPSRQIDAILAEHGCLVRGGSEFVGLNERWIRFAVKTRTENELMLAALTHLRPDNQS